MFIAELQHFLDCVNKKCLPAVGGTDGRRVLEIALAAKASARESRPVKL
jgi:predicted dehydrogenase